MNNYLKNSMSNNEEQQYLKEMKKNNLLFEQKLQKLKEKSYEFQQKEKYHKNIKPIKNKQKAFLSPRIEYNNPNSLSNYYKNTNNDSSLIITKQESMEAKSAINKEYNINNVSNITIKDYLFNDDEIFNNSEIDKDIKIKELIKNNQELKNEL